MGRIRTLIADDIIIEGCSIEDTLEHLISCRDKLPDMTDQRFIAAFVAMNPEAEPDRHRSVIEAPMYRLISVLVTDGRQAEQVCSELVKREGVTSFILCPGFTNQDVGRLSAVLGPDISVNVSRGDGPSNAIAHKEMEKAGFFKH